MVHLSYAALADGAVMCAIRLNAAALGALVEHLALAVAHLLDHFLGGIATRHCALDWIRCKELKQVQHKLFTTDLPDPRALCADAIRMPGMQVLGI